MVPTLVYLEAYPLFINTALSYLPLLVMWSALVEGAAGERPWWVLVGAAALLADTYLAFGLLFLPLVAVALLGAARPLRAAVAAGGVFLCVFGASSLQALFLAASFLVRRPVALTGAVVVAVGVGFLLLKGRRRWAQVSAERRVFITLAGATLLWFLGGVPVLVGLQPDFDPLPFFPVAPGLVLLGVGAFRATRRPLLRGLLMLLALASVIAAFGAVRSAAVSSHLTFGEAEALARVLRDEGFSPAATERILQGPLVRRSSLLETLAVFDDEAMVGSRSWRQSRIQVLLHAGEGEPTAGWRRIPCSSGRSLLWQVRKPSLNTSWFRICEGPSPQGSCWWVNDAPGSGSDERVDPYLGPLLARQAFLQWVRPRGAEVTYGFFLTPEAEAGLTLILSPDAKERFIQLEGVDGEILDGGTRVRLSSITGGRGRVWITSWEDTPRRWYPPTPLELDPGVDDRAFRSGAVGP